MLSVVAEMRADVAASKRAQRWGPKNDLRHPGAQIPHARELRLIAFLERNPGWREREIAQRGEYVLERLRRP